jgi:hypothetical protein
MGWSAGIALGITVILALAGYLAKYLNDHKPGGGPFWGTEPPPTPEEAAAYRLWMTSVFIPLDEGMAEIVVSKADLLDDQAMPNCLTELCAHVAGPRSAGDLAEHTFHLNFPQDVYEYVGSGFSRLKQEQARLLERDKNRRSD